MLKRRFELRRHLGHGRVSEVFEAWDRETKAPVAVKLLFPYLAADHEVRDWFFHGANALIVAPHPRLLKVHSVHETPEGCFSVCALMSGVTLRDQLHARPDTAGGWNPAEVRKVGTALCEALVKLHAVGAHGEVAPGNVWVDAHGGVTLMDAGLSAPPGKAVRWPPSTDLAAALYDAPEVLRGAPPEPRSDLYSVGAILYQMLTGELPAGLFPPLAQSAGIPRDLAEAVDRAMSPKPENRFASAEEMARFLSGEVLHGREKSRRRLVLVGGGIAALLLLGGGGLYAFQHRGPDPALVARADDARGQAEAAEKGVLGLGGFADAKILAVGRDAIRRGDAARAESRLEAAEAEYGSARKVLEAEAAAGREKETAARKAKELAERAKASAAALDRAIEGAPEDGTWLTAAPGVHEKLLRKEQEASKGLLGIDLVKATERVEALRHVQGLATRVAERWAKFLAEGEPLKKAREERDRAKALLEAGDTAGADFLAREAGGRLDAGLRDALGAALRDLCTGAGVPEPEGAAAVRAGKVPAAYAPLFPDAFEAARAKFEKAEQAKRCAECGAEGKCKACEGTGGARSDCVKCAGRGFFEVDCPKCSGKKDLACARCAGKALLDETCAACKGAKTTACSKCGGSTPKCEACKGDGKRSCMRCRGTGTIHAGGEKGKPCPDCGATGKRGCPVCKGAGSRLCDACQGKNLVDCAACNGAGTKPVPCPDCKATGRVPCPDCGATGKRKDDCADCDGGKVLAPCPACSGKGLCPACGGRGRKE